ncbi:Protein of unknown function [Tissierella praeacuta DSM 18095]|uniref:DUF3798 domain-containing protein n=1 Tax=Tissierella praeacuta DSM 18095 TaxID=1123404 RepID=A0A1M4X5Y8_9FIRM|nr:DUF3798 domain-containing protein [Tissierella praeacuta]TCU65782.1 uncharacterized protein DUF3798 [Tissierella praeacuta]SHE88542.1 Protein of unknown function [Tissierella praeacuta DSM 18095]SUO99726.1 Protein of uncharacterised function (DUF3798) [Tissierella praeacuta]
MKKILVLLLVTMLVITSAGCGAKTTSDVVNEPNTDGGDVVEKTDYKIGIVTGTVSQGEEEFRAGERMVAKYGDMIKHITYPDKFAQEQETTIAQVASLAADKDVKAIIFVQAVPGAAAAIDKVRETRPDMLFILGAPHEDPEAIASRADIALELDQLQRGESVVHTAKEMGAKTFIHYSFPRHMSYELLSARRDIFKKTCGEVGLEFVEVDAPDPLSDAGVPGAQQFILEDVPRQVEKYGKDTAFFSTNCAMQEPLIKQALETGAIYPEQCCPSPYHAYPGALGIEIPADKAGDLDYLSEQIASKIAEKGGTGRFGTWNRPANVAMIEAGVEYAKAYCEGKIDKFDKDSIVNYMKEVTDDKNDEVKFSELENTPNFLLFVLGSQVF